MAASGKKRKRELQDDNFVADNNFDYLRQIGESKKRKLTEEQKAPVKKLFEDGTFTRELRSSKRLKGLITTPSKIRRSSFDEDDDRSSSSNTSKTPRSFQRRNSLVRIRKPLTTFTGTLKTKLAEQVRRSSMRGQQDYSLPIAATRGPQDHLRFMSVLQQQTDEGQTPEEDQYLQQKIDHEIRMRDGTAKLLAASKHPQQMLEAAKNLLTSNARMLSYMGELQRRKTDEVLKREFPEDGNQVPCKAKISVSDIRVPLMWKDAEHFRSKGDHRRYAVFCLVKIGTEIYDTALLKDVDRTMTDLGFEDVVCFSDIPQDFECKLEVYCHRCQDDLSVVSTPKRIRKKIEDFGNSVGRSVGRRLSGLKDDTDPSMIIGPKFECIGTGTLKLADVTDYTGTFNLTLESDASGMDLPLFGNFCCRLAAQPYCLVQDTISGQLHLQDSKSLSWQPYWCRLRNLAVSCWLKKEDMATAAPDIAIPVTKTTQVSEVPTTLCQRQHCIQITSQTFVGRTSYNIAALNQEDKVKWWDAIYQHLLDQVMWLQACETVMEIKSVTPRRHSVYRRKGLSLYDDMGAADSSPMTKMLNRLNIPEQREEEDLEDALSKDDETMPEESQEEEVKVTDVKTEEPKVTEVKTEEPKVTDVKTEEPKVTEVKTEEPTVTEVKTEEPKVTDVKTEEPKVTEVKTEEPKVTEVKTEELKVTDVQAEELNVIYVKANELKVTEAAIEEPDVIGIKDEEPKVKDIKAEESQVSDVKETNAEAREPNPTNVDVTDIKVDDAKTASFEGEQRTGEDAVFEDDLTAGVTETESIPNTDNVKVTVDSTAEDGKKTVSEFTEEAGSGTENSKDSATVIAEAKDSQESISKDTSTEISDELNSVSPQTIPVSSVPPAPECLSQSTVTEKSVIDSNQDGDTESSESVQPLTDSATDDPNPCGSAEPEPETASDVNTTEGGAVSEVENAELKASEINSVPMETDVQSSEVEESAPEVCSLACAANSATEDVVTKTSDDSPLLDASSDMDTQEAPEKEESDSKENVEEDTGKSDQVLKEPSRVTRDVSAETISDSAISDVNASPADDDSDAKSDGDMSETLRGENEESITDMPEETTPCEGDTDGTEVPPGDQHASEEAQKSDVPAKAEETVSVEEANRQEVPADLTSAVADDPLRKQNANTDVDCDASDNLPQQQQASDPEDQSQHVSRQPENDNVSDRDSARDSSTEDPADTQETSQKRKSGDGDPPDGEEKVNGSQDSQVDSLSEDGGNVSEHDSPVSGGEVDEPAGASLEPDNGEEVELTTKDEEVSTAGSKTPTSNGAVGGKASTPASSGKKNRKRNRNKNNRKKQAAQSVKRSVSMETTV